MGAHQSQAVNLAIKLVLERGYSISAAAERHGIYVSTLRRALRRAGVAPKAPGKPKAK